MAGMFMIRERMAISYLVDSFIDPISVIISKFVSLVMSSSSEPRQLSEVKLENLI